MRRGECTEVSDAEHRTRVDCGQLIAYRDGQHRQLDRGVLVHEGGTVVFVGEDYDGPCDERIDATDKVVAPGFVSLHTHMAGSPFDKSLQDDFTNWHMWGTGLYELLMPIRNATTPSSARAALRASCLELIRSGVTTAVDLTTWAEEAVEAAREAGLRLYVGQYIRSSSWATDGFTVSYQALSADEERAMVDTAVEFIERHTKADDLVRGILAPAQVDTCSPELLREIGEIAQDMGIPLQIHAGQSVIEFREMMRRTGMTPVAFLAELGLLGPRLTIGHCMFVAGHSWVEYAEGDDLALLAQSGATVAHCPSVFARKGQGLESLGAYLRRGIKVALGLDTSPQSMLVEMRVAGTIGKILGRSGRSVTAKQLFDAATVDGARALDREDIGRIAVGCKADYVVYRTNSLTMTPLRDPVRNIAYSALPSDIDRVVINGAPVLVDGRPTYTDEEEIVRDLQDAAVDVWSKLGEHHHAERSVDEISLPSLKRW